MEFEKAIMCAKRGDQRATEYLLRQYEPLLSHESVVNGQYVEDLYQEICITFWRCLQMFCAS